MPENQKEVKSCHNCGLEAIDNCEIGKGHIPDDENLAPCKYCARNPDKAKVAVIADFYSETWCRNSDHSPIIEDPDATEQKLLRFLQAFESVYAVV